jgi:hypothetical protein
MKARLPVIKFHRNESWGAHRKELCLPEMLDEIKERLEWVTEVNHNHQCHPFNQLQRGVCKLHFRVINFYFPLSFLILPSTAKEDFRRM